MAYETFSPEEVDGIVYRSTPKSTPAAQPAPMQSSALPPVTSPVKPSKPKAAEPNVSQLVQNVSEANRSIQESTPAPQAPSAIDALVSDITSNWKTVLGAAAVPAIGWMASKMMGGKSTEESKPKAIKDRLLVPSDRVEPTFSPPSKVGPITNMPGTPEELQKALGPNWEATLAKSEAARKEKQMLAQERARASMGELPAPTAQPPVAGGQPAAPSPVAQVAAETAPVAPPTVAQIAQQAAPAVAEAAQAPAAAIPPAEKNKGGFPKGATRLPANIKDTPETWQKFTKEGLTFLPGYGPGDNNLYNTYGAEGRRAILEKYNEGKPIGTYENYLKLNEKLKKGVPASEVPALMSRLPSEDEAGNYSKLGKAAKVAGVGGLLISAANLANAKTPGERSLAGANLLGAVIPPAANINEAGAPVLPPNILAAQQRQLEEMQKLGSPYRKR